MYVLACERILYCDKHRELGHPHWLVQVPRLRCRDPDTYGDSNSNVYTYSDSHFHTDCHSHGNSYVYSDTYGYGHIYTDTDSDAYTYANPKLQRADSATN